MVDIIFETPVQKGCIFFNYICVYLYFRKEKYSWNAAEDIFYQIINPKEVS